MITAVTSSLLGAVALGLYLWLRRRPGGPIDLRSVLARLPLPMLALAASYGVYSFATLFVPPAVAATQAAAFELTYIGLAVTRGLSTAQRKRATAISVGAVVASIVYNTLAGWFHRQPQLLDQATSSGWLLFAILHGAPLAWVAYLVADLLLHSDAPMQTNASPTDAPDAPMQLDAVTYARPNAPEEVHFSPPQSGEMQHRACPNCGSLLDAKHYAAAKRWNRCAACKGASQ